MSARVAATTSGGRPAGRYGDDRPRRFGRVAAVGLALLVAVAVVWWVWVAALRSTPAVRWDLVGFGPVTDTSVDIRWVVEQEPGVAVECILRARDASGQEVGRDRFAVPAADGTATELHHTLKTSSRPVTGEVLACVELSG